MKINPIQLGSSHQIDFIKSAGNYIIIHYNHAEKKNIVRYLIGNIEKDAIDNNLIRIHNCYVVNITRVADIKQYKRSYKLKNSHRLLPVSRKNLPEVRRKFRNASLHSEIVFTRNDPGYPF